MFGFLCHFWSPLSLVVESNKHEMVCSIYIAHSGDWSLLQVSSWPNNHPSTVSFGQQHAMPSLFAMGLTLHRTMVPWLCTHRVYSLYVTLSITWRSRLVCCPDDCAPFWLKVTWRLLTMGSKAFLCFKSWMMFMTCGLMPHLCSVPRSSCAPAFQRLFPHGAWKGWVRPLQSIFF